MARYRISGAVTIAVKAWSRVRLQRNSRDARPGADVSAPEARIGRAPIRLDEATQRANASKRHADVNASSRVYVAGTPLARAMIDRFESPYPRR